MVLARRLKAQMHCNGGELGFPVAAGGQRLKGVGTRTSLPIGLLAWSSMIDVEVYRPSDHHARIPSLSFFSADYSQ